MNRTNIEWVRNPDGSKGLTWNPQVGCDNICPYCYARRIAQRFSGTKAFPNGFEPTWHPERLKEPKRVKKPSRVFVGSMSDIFADWVKDEWIDDILDIMADCPQHTFYLLTKQPQNIVDKLGNFNSKMLPNVWLGASIDIQARADMSIKHMYNVTHTGWNTFVSIEPLLTAIEPLSIAWASWVIIGALTGPGAKKHQPDRSWVEILIDYCDRRGTPVFVKDSLQHVSNIQQWPKE